MTSRPRWRNPTIIDSFLMSRFACALHRRQVCPVSFASGHADDEHARKESNMSAASESGSDDDELGPIDFLAVEFPGARITSGGFGQLLALADGGVIGILDMEFVASDSDG